MILVMTGKHGGGGVVGSSLRSPGGRWPRMWGRREEEKVELQGSVERRCTTTTVWHGWVGGRTGARGGGRGSMGARVGCRCSTGTGFGGQDSTGSRVRGQGSTGTGVRGVNERQEVESVAALAQWKLGAAAPLW
jgi:hypothetical protein